MFAPWGPQETLRWAENVFNKLFVDVISKESGSAEDLVTDTQKHGNVPRYPSINRVISLCIFIFV
jgi:hypothetical protein